MALKSYYINEGRHFDISDEDRAKIEKSGFKFYNKYVGERVGNQIVLFRPSQYLKGIDVTESFPYNPDIFVH